MNTKARVFAYLEQHPEADNAALYAAFPDVSEGVCRTYRAEFRNQGKPANPHQTSILAESETPAPSPKPPRQDSDLAWLRENRKALERILSKQNASKSISPASAALDTEIRGPVKVRSYSIAEDVHREFAQAAKRAGLSQRKALHAAMRLFSQAGH